MPSVEERVVEIVCENLGVNKEQVKRETRFIEDIGADGVSVLRYVLIPAHDMFGRARSNKHRGVSWKRKARHDRLRIQGISAALHQRLHVDHVGLCDGVRSQAIKADDQNARGIWHWRRGRCRAWHIDRGEGSSALSGDDVH